MLTYVIIDVGGPETGDGPIIGVGGEDRRGGRPDLVDILDDEE